MAGRPSRQPRPSSTTCQEPSLRYQQHQPAQRPRKRRRSQPKGGPGAHGPVSHWTTLPQQGTHRRERPSPSESARGRTAPYRYGACLSREPHTARLRCCWPRSRAQWPSAGLPRPRQGRCQRPRRHARPRCCGRPPCHRCHARRAHWRRRGAPNRTAVARTVCRRASPASGQTGESATAARPATTDGWLAFRCRQAPSTWAHPLRGG